MGKARNALVCHLIATTCISNIEAQITLVKVDNFPKTEKQIFRI